MGHLHQRSEHSETTLSGKIITTYSLACLSQLRPAFNRNNNWGHGFGFVEIDGRKFRVDNKKIIDGEVF